ncbi:MAG: tRNA(Ile)(2)-agmatinylcytidine synthase [Candidatus Altiarchaeota archaeon]
MFIGIDDTDSRKGGCTTYIAALLCEKLKVVGYPKLIRLNPNIPFKTRGNGAISLKIFNDDKKAKEIVLETVEKFSKFPDDDTNPGVVFLSDINFRKNKKTLEKFYLKAVSELVTMKEAEKIAKKINAEVYKFKNGRGIIGALAAIGSELENDKTYELLSYRIPENYGKKRKIFNNSIFEMNERTFPETFDNIDFETGEIRILPHGYDPVFCGIRGETPNAVESAWKILKPLEKIERIQIFETNQATDAHLREKKISNIKPYDCVVIDAIVRKKPKKISGGHVIFEIDDGTGKIDCAAYKKTGNFRDLVMKLTSGDKIRVFGGVAKYIKTINLEKLKILKLKKIFKKEKPYCCGRVMTSAGKNKGYKCRKCGKRAIKDKILELKRDLNLGFYEVAVRARRHIAKPLIRMK